MWGDQTFLTPKEAQLKETIPRSLIDQMQFDRSNIGDLMKRIGTGVSGLSRSAFITRLA